MVNGSFTIHSAHYKDTPRSVAEFVDLGDAVVLATPSGDEEPFRFAKDESFVVRPFEVVRSFAGGLKPGKRIFVVRSDYPGAAIQPEVPFDALMYVLSLRDKGVVAGKHVWYPVGGPSGRLPLVSLDGAMRIVPESSTTPMQALLSGMSLDQIEKQVKQAVNAGEDAAQS